MRRKGKPGFTLVEVTIILLVLVILGGILLPMAEEFLDLARIARVKEDVGALTAVILKFKFDNCESYFKADGDGPVDAWNRIDLLVGDGSIPAITPLISFGMGYWNQPVGYGGWGNLFVDTIENHLALGDPYGPLWGDPYPRPHKNDPYECGWRGAYIQTPVIADPWGNRYMINVAFLGPAGDNSRLLGVGSAAAFLQGDTFVLSAGPNETVETPFYADGVVAGQDDQIAVVAGSSAFSW